MNKFFRHLIVCMCLLSVVISISSSQVLAHSWPMAGRDISRSGQTSEPGAAEGMFSWSYTFFSPDCRGGAAVARDGKLYIGTDRDTGPELICLDSDGSFVWSYELNHDIDTVPAIGIKSVYVSGGLGGTPSRISAFSFDGDLQWSYATGDADYISSIALDGRENIYFGCKDNNLYCLKSLGSLSWSYEAANVIEADCAIGADGDVYFASFDTKLYRTTSLGSLQWSFNAGFASDPHSGVCVTDDGKIYYAAGRFWRINADGTAGWSFNVGAAVQDRPAFDSDGKIYFGATNNKLYCIKNDAIEWTYEVAEDISTSPAIDVNGIVYTGSMDNKIYAISSKGVFQWSYAAGGDMREGTDITISDYKIYIPSYDNNLYCLVGLTPTPTSTPQAYKSLIDIANHVYDPVTKSIRTE